MFKLSLGKKLNFIEKLRNVINKYNWNDINTIDIRKNLLDNNKEVLLIDLKVLLSRIKVKLNVEERLFITDQIENNVQLRLEQMDTNKTLMLDSILNRNKKSININRLLIKQDNQEEAELILDREEILTETRKHFKSFSDNIIDNSQELNVIGQKNMNPKII